MRNLMLPTICGKVQLQLLSGSPQGGSYSLTTWRRDMPLIRKGFYGRMHPVGEARVFTSYAEGRKAAYEAYSILLNETKAFAKELI